jgi:hypothetical protein
MLSSNTQTRNTCCSPTFKNGLKLNVFHKILRVPNQYQKYDVLEGSRLCITSVIIQFYQNRCYGDMYIWNRFKWVRVGTTRGLWWALPSAKKIVHRDGELFNSISTCDRLLFYAVGNILAPLPLISVSCCFIGVCSQFDTLFVRIYNSNSLQNKHKRNDESLWHSVQRQLTFA